MTEIKIDGHLQVKEDGLRAWIWSKRYVVLRDQTITFHRNEVNINKQTTIKIILLIIKIIIANRSMCSPHFLERNHQCNSFRT